MSPDPVVAILELWTLVKAKRAPSKERQAYLDAQAKQAKKKGGGGREIDKRGQELPKRAFDGKFTSGEGGEVSYEAHPEAGPDPRYPDRHEKDHGMHWLSDPTRTAIYHRDGGACVWCGNKAEDGHQLTGDHLTVKHHGGTNKPSNVVTSCMSCNSHRQDKDPNEFAKMVAPFVGTTPDKILAHIKKCVETPITSVHRAAANAHNLKHKSYPEAVKNVPEHVKRNRADHHAHVVMPKQW